MRIGVSGASGVVGAAVLNYLKTLVPQAQLVGISRTPEKLAIEGVEMRYGDYDKPRELQLAYAGLQRVLLIPSLDMQPVRGCVSTLPPLRQLCRPMSSILYFSRRPIRGPDRSTRLTIVILFPNKH